MEFDMQHPYSNLPGKAFWKSAIAGHSLFDIADLWQPKHTLERENKVVTFGSCFAQHIGRALSTAGFNWWNVEPGFNNASPELLAKFGYGVFSARTGNVYTTKALRQWVDWSLGKSSVPAEVWEKNGRFFDPFRPTVEPDGFETKEELAEARKATLACLRKAFSQADTIIFTLGLTEAWEHVSGYVYAGCPGVVAGTYSDQEHKFRNYTHAMVLEDLRHVIALVRSQNPTVRFLLTVSPVPLTATASGEHVLVANTYSKSLLRAGAGQAAAEDPAVDYFPSFEIINAHPFRAVFFDPNLRTVNRAGVAHVMKHFIGALGEFPQPTFEAQVVPPTAERSASDVQCDEEMLESFATTKVSY